MTILSLGDLNITTAGSQETDWVTISDSVEQLLIEARLLYGSGGTTAQLYIQTQLPDGTTDMDIACLAFGMANAVKVVNLSRKTPKTTPLTPTDGALADNTCVDGVIGRKVKCKLVTVGTYAGSTALSVRAQAT